MISKDGLSKDEVILWAVRWYCRYGISYRDLETMLCERDVSVDHSTIYRDGEAATLVLETPGLLSKLADG